MHVAVLASNEVPLQSTSAEQTDKQSAKVWPCLFIRLSPALRVTPMYVVLYWMPKVTPLTVVAVGRAGEAEVEVALDLEADDELDAR